MQTMIASIFVFGLLILAHEVGHFLAARANGIRVMELAIGFGPRLLGWQSRKSGTLYSMRIFPLGGFCRMLGENPEDSCDAADSFARKGLLQRATVLLAGASMNLVLAVFLFFIIFFFLVGVPVTESPALGSVTPGLPAARAGFQPGDVILTIEGEQIRNWEEVTAGIELHPGEEISVVVKRDEEIKELRVVPEPVPQTGRGVIGITPVYRRYDLAGSLGESFSRFGALVGSLVQVVTGRAPLDITGPVGIIIIVGEVAATGFVNLLWLAAVISVSLGLINLFPIPALDGGRILFLAIEGIRGKPLDPEKEGFIHFIGFALLILLIIFITYNDLIRWELIPH